MLPASLDRSQVEDVIIVGGGPAGLSAALVLGRCRRRVVLFDDADPRNIASRNSHGFFTRDGTSPLDLRAQGAAQLIPYSVRCVQSHVTAVAHHSNVFQVNAGSDTWHSKKLLLATGMRDFEPEVPGLRELVGVGVFHCPYCDGWEQRDRRLGCYAPGADGTDAALGLLTWSASVSLFTDGHDALTSEAHSQLGRNGVQVYEEPIARLEACGGRLCAVRLVSGARVTLDAMFIHAGQEQRSPLIRQLGCELAPNGAARTESRQSTKIPGLYIAGDAAISVQSIAVAAAEGYVAGVAINRELREEQHSVAS